jgi:hypothetical protein
LLIGILLPAISKARDSAKVTESLANLRNMAAAHQSYAAEWNDRQFTLLPDDQGLYQSCSAWADAHCDAGGLSFPPCSPQLILGSGWVGTQYGDPWTYVFSENPGGQFVSWPIDPTTRFGWFRGINCRQFNTYVSGRFYDKAFFAPKDRAAMDAVADYFEAPGEYSSAASGNQAKWCSYALSPAALFAPAVFNAKDPTLKAQSMTGMGGGAFRVPSMSQARNPSLKTHMLEHHWLQNNRGNICNQAFGDGLYDGCEPYYFNHSIDSAPATMFFDGSVRTMGVKEPGDADATLRQEAATPWAGLYFRPEDEGFDEAGNLSSEGYFLQESYDTIVDTVYRLGYHILTKDGILGRDTIGGQ